MTENPQRDSVVSDRAPEPVGAFPHAKRVGRLTDGGFSQEEIARITGPAGLDINAKTPSEIALSIMAEVVAAKRSKAATS